MNKSQFEQLFKTGRQIRGKAIRMFVCAGCGDVGFATSRTLGCHARRNRIKRRLRQLQAELMPKELATKVDLIYLATTECKERTYGELRTEVEDLIRQLLAHWESGSL